MFFGKKIFFEFQNFTFPETSQMSQMARTKECFIFHTPCSKYVTKSVFCLAAKNPVHSKMDLKKLQFEIFDFYNFKNWFFSIDTETIFSPISQQNALELRSADFIFIMLHKIRFHLLLGRGTCPDSGSSSTCPCRLVNTVLKLYFLYQNLSRFITIFYLE